MPVPKYDELYEPFLLSIQEDGLHALKKIENEIAVTMNLSQEDMEEYLPSGKQTIFKNRVGWARTYLKKAKLINSPKRGYFEITPEGQKLLHSGKKITNELLAEKYPEFANFVGHKVQEQRAPDESEVETPQETFEHMYRVINGQLSDDLLTEIMNQSPVFFEKLVVDLMRAMDYGDGFVTKASGDGGIDGIIPEDKLGFNLIYIQAKRWNPDITISKPEIQKFAGAMMGPPKIEKGLFITTAKFSQGAQEFAKAQHIILVDGEHLTELMIEYGVGVSTQQTYQVKRVDSDYFSDN